LFAGSDICLVYQTKQKDYMKTFILFIFALFSLNLTASVDDRLQSYIEKFNLKKVEKPETLNEELFSLGRDLFFNPELSGNRNISCADCHHPETFTTDKLLLSLGEGAEGRETYLGGRQQMAGKIIPRNSPALFNLHQVPSLFWDGRVFWDKRTDEVHAPVALNKNEMSVLKDVLGVQALFPLVSHEEMRGVAGTNEIANAKSEREAWELIFKRIYDNNHYKKALNALFPNETHSIFHLARAIAHFEAHAFYASDTNYDDYLSGNHEALSEKEKRGMDVFFSKGECWKCHKGEQLSDFSFHNIGVPQIGPGISKGDDKGLFERTKNPAHLYAFRVPPLRNVALTAPYFHDGSMRTLEEVIEHYDEVIVSLKDFTFTVDYPNYVEVIKGPDANTHESKINSLSFKLRTSLEFTEEEEDDLIYFLRESLTDRRYKMKKSL